MARPRADEAAEYFHRYISIPEGDSVSEIVNKYAFELQEFYNNLPESRADFAYAEGKWTVKEVLQHVADTERIFAYRALRISRGDTTPLASFGQDVFVKNGFAADRSLSSLKQEFNAVRASTDIFLLSLNEEEINRRGTASDNAVSVNALAYMIYGHLLHHRRLLQEYYGV